MGRRSRISITLVDIVSGGLDSSLVLLIARPVRTTRSYASAGVYDAANPFNNSARPNSWTPPLSTPWNFSTDRINGVNLGGLFVMEPFITPQYYQQYLDDGAVDEWTLDVAFRAHENISTVMEAHYSEFVTEQDIAEIAGECFVCVLTLERERLMAVRRGGPELDPAADAVLGDRGVGRRGHAERDDGRGAVPRADVLELHPRGPPLGAQVRHPRQLGLAYHTRESEWCVCALFVLGGVEGRV